MIKHNLGLSDYVALCGSGEETCRGIVLGKEQRKIDQIPRQCLESRVNGKREELHGYFRYAVFRTVQYTYKGTIRNTGYT